MKTISLASLSSASIGIALVLASVGALVGCSSSPSSSSTSSADKPADIDVVQSAQVRNTTPTLTPAELDTLAKGQANFAVDILKSASKATPSDNVFLSPHSISIALGMTYAGARGDTAAEMKKALHLDLPDDRVHVGFDYLDLQLASRGQGDLGSDSKPFRLNIANSIWSQTGMPIVPAFLDTIAVNYGAGVNAVDFIHATEPSRLAINGWVEQKTEERIKDLIPQGVLTPDARMVLVNAVYFNAAWQNKFDASVSRPGSFTKLDGSKSDVTMMSQQSGFNYSSTDAFDAIELPYDGNELSMFILMPKAGTFAAFESALTGDKVLDAFAGLQNELVQLDMPKVKLEQQFELSDALKSLGMVKAFDAADFSGITTEESLQISKVVHKTFLQVDEAGTEAAAATAVVMTGGAAPETPPQPKFMTVDHPYITAIVDKQTRTLVFVGNIVAPASL